MFHYKYNANTCVIVGKLTVPYPVGTTYCTSAEDLDIDLNEIIVGFVGKNKELLKYTSRTRPVEELANILKVTKESLNILEEKFNETQAVLDFLLMM